MKRRLRFGHKDVASVAAFVDDDYDLGRSRTRAMVVRGRSRDTHVYERRNETTPDVATATKCDLRVR